MDNVARTRIEGIKAVGVVEWKENEGKEATENEARRHSNLEVKNN